MAIWDQPAGVLGGAEVSLNQIEHERLRLKWAEPELHACIVCASTSCPDLADFAREAGVSFCVCWTAVSSRRPSRKEPRRPSE